MDISKIKHTKKSIFFFVLTLMSYIYIAGSVDKSISPSDLKAIQQLKVNQFCDDRLSFDDEIMCIRATQKAVSDSVKSFSCAQWGESVEPASFLGRGFGCCFDRARFIEKTLSYYGYETRRVALYDRDAYGLLGLLIPGIDSHATTEVKTSKGWMGVDSVYPFLLITNNNEVFTYSNMKAKNNDLMYNVEPKSFYEKNLIVIYGLYSRHGMFHGINAPTPEFNFSEILFNL